jgi:hypothetical protein
MNYTKTNLVKALRSTNVDITFVKENGRTRKLRATLVDGSFPSQYKRDVSKTVRNVKNQDHITVYSVEDQGFRTIRFDSIKNAKRAA